MNKLFTIILGIFSIIGFVFSLISVIINITYNGISVNTVIFRVIFSTIIMALIGYLFYYFALKYIPDLFSIFNIKNNDENHIEDFTDNMNLNSLKEYNENTSSFYDDDFILNIDLSVDDIDIEEKGNIYEENLDKFLEKGEKKTKFVETNLRDLSLVPQGVKENTVSKKNNVNLNNFNNAQNLAQGIRTKILEDED